MCIMKGGNLPTCATWTACYRCHRFCFDYDPASFVSLFSPFCLVLFTKIVSFVLLWGIQSPHWLPMEYVERWTMQWCFVIRCGTLHRMVRPNQSLFLVFLIKVGRKMSPRNNKERWKGSSFSLPDNVIWTRVSPFKYPCIADQKMRSCS